MNQASDHVLELKDNNKSFGSKAALTNVSLKLASGETHVLLGLSGSGKTTVIRIVLGLIGADSGQLIINGKLAQFDGKRGASEWSRQIGYVPQEGGLFPHLTCLKNITLVAELSGWDKKKIATRVEQLIELVSLDSAVLHRYPAQLSGGQRQRIALMRAAFLDPALLILDEPLGALDPLIRIDVQNELKQIFNGLGKSALLVTHDIDEARFFADRLSLMREGKIVQTGTFDDLLNSPSEEFVTRFIRSQRVWADK